jgi:hypothetical protein
MSFPIAQADELPARAIAQALVSVVAVVAVLERLPEALR